MSLIYLSPVSWSSFSQRPHEFVRWYNDKTGYDVLWLEPYPTRLPSLRDFNRIIVKQKGQQNNKPDWLHIVNVPSLPLEPLPGSGYVFSLMWKSIMIQIDAFIAARNVMIGVGKPSVLALNLMSRYKKLYTFYDAMDNFSAFYSGVSRAAMHYRERKVVNSVKTVLVSSTHLKHKWQQVKKDVRLVPNGINSNLSARQSIKKEDNDKKIFGYVGTIAKWFDWDWVIQLALLRKEDVVRLVGPISKRPTKVLPKNIELIPPCGHEEAIAHMEKFDIGLIPFKNNALTDSVDPIKYYEYRALGIPIVSTIFGEMANRGSIDRVFLSKDLDDIENKVKGALAQKNTQNSIDDFRRSNTWKVRFDSSNLI